MTDELPAHLPPIPFNAPERDKAYFMAPRKPEHRCAVMYQGEFETPWDGTAVAVRSHARALSLAGIPVLLRSFTGTVVDEHGNARPAHSIDPDPQVEREVGKLQLTTAEHYYPTIKHLVVRDAEHLKRVVMPQGAVDKDFEKQAELRRKIFASTIVYSVWERDRVDPGIVKTLSRVAECWVPCWANAHMLAASGVPEEKIFVVPHPFDPADPILKLQRRKPDPGWMKFYSIGRWEPRKGYAKLVHAFLEAFTPQDHAILTIKYTGGKWPGYPTPEETIARCQDDPTLSAIGWTPEKIRERVKLIEGRFPRASILELHYRNNIYVSSSHGEAWNLPAFEACLAGNQVVYVPSGGVDDFVGNGHVAVAPSDPEPVPKSYGWESDAMWMGYLEGHLAEALLKASAPTTHDVSVTKGIDLRQYSLEAVGKLMRFRVEQIAGAGMFGVVK
jgi:glycosyltransferase involved in cell wall biosynthesis